MNKEQKDHLLQYLSKGIRYDGRKLLESRPVTIEVGISQSAEGSARVKIGTTDVMAGVKIAAEKPYGDTPDQGNLMVNAELYPLSSPKFETGPPGEQAIEVARVTDRGIRESKAIDVKKLCITPRELVWGVAIDVVTVNDGGDIMDAAALAAMAAVRHARFPALKDGKVDYGARTTMQLPISSLPVSVTVYKIGPHFLIDPLPEEEDAADARLTITTTEDGLVRAMQKGGATPLTIDEIDTMVKISLERAPELRKLLKQT